MFPQDTIQKGPAIPFGRLRIARGGELPDQMEMTLSCFPVVCGERSRVVRIFQATDATSDPESADELKELKAMRNF